MGAATRATTAVRRLVRAVLLLLLVLAGSLLALTGSHAPSHVPPAWPAAGLLAGLLVISPAWWRVWLALAGTGLMTAALLAAGTAPAVAGGFAVSTGLAAYVVRPLLVRGRGAQRVALLAEGDVAQMIGAIAASSGVAAVGFGLTDLLTGTGNPVLGAVAAWAVHAAAMMVLVPLFLPTPTFTPLGGQRERLVQGAITLGTSVVVFAFSDVPPVVFIVMPMFAWHAYRGTLREATLLLTTIGGLGTALTIAGLGPIASLQPRYSLAPELVNGVLQLFLLDCGLILLPLSVMLTQLRMTAARAAADRERLDRLVATATGTGVVVVGADGLVATLNPVAEQMLARRGMLTVGRPAEILLDPAELARHAGRLGVPATVLDVSRASASTGESQRRWVFTGAGGELRDLRLTFTLVPDTEGGAESHLITAEDVTEREAKHRSLLQTLEHERAAGERLRDLERAQSDFVAAVSHELRTPITSIMGYLELLDDVDAVGDLTDFQRELIGRADRNSRRLLLLVEDLLTLARMESSQMVAELRPTDLRAVSRDALEALETVLAGRELALSVDLPTEPLVVDLDPVLIERLLVNLLTNAVKFTPDGGRIGLALDRGPDDEAVVRVSDSGQGIPQEEQSLLFTRFFRSSNATANAIQGTGLGLTIVQAIVELHGGKVGFTSTEGQGTVFEVRLPRGLAASPPDLF